MPKAIARQQLNLDIERRIMLWVGDPRPEKRLDIIRAAHKLLQERHKQLDLVTIQGVSHETIPVHMNAADVLVLASDCEGSPVVIKEAMACNLPVVSVAVGDVPEIVGKTEGCYICERTPEDMATKIESALEFGKRTSGRKAIEHLQVRGMTDQILELYQDTLDRQ